PGLCHGCRKEAALARKASSIALKCSKAAQRNEVLLIKSAHPSELLVHQRDLLRLRIGLFGQARYLLLQLRDSLAQLRLLSALRLAAQLKQLSLTAHDAAGGGIVVCLVQKFRGIDDVIGAVPFGLEARAPRRQ